MKPINILANNCSDVFIWVNVFFFIFPHTLVIYQYMKSILYAWILYFLIEYKYYRKLEKDERKNIINWNYYKSSLSDRATGNILRYSYIFHFSNFYPK